MDAASYSISPRRMGRATGPIMTDLPAPTSHPMACPGGNRNGRTLVSRNVDFFRIIFYGFRHVGASSPNLMDL